MWLPRARMPARSHRRCSIYSILPERWLSCLPVVSTWLDILPGKGCFLTIISAQARGRVAPACVRLAEQSEDFAHQIDQQGPDDREQPEHGDGTAREFAPKEFRSRARQMP